MRERDDHSPTHLKTNVAPKMMDVEADTIAFTWLFLTMSFGKDRGAGLPYHLYRYPYLPVGPNLDS